MISHDYCCIFIHIPKTAGTSIEKKLGLHADIRPGGQDHRSIREIEPMPAYGIWGARNLVDLRFVGYRVRSKLKGRDMVTPDQFQSYYKFTFIRNPWSRVYSWYKNVMRFEPHRKRLGVPDDCSFKDFLSFDFDQGALRPQTYWIRDSKGRNRMDFIGRFENLSEDFAHVCDVLQIGDPSLPKLIVGDGSHYTDYYDEKSREIVRQKYQEEIELFNFKYGQ